MRLAYGVNMLVKLVGLGLTTILGKDLWLLAR